jgi:CheY-like chemotaxis protein
LVPGTYSEPTTPPATLTARLELTKALQRGESQPLTPPADPGPGLSMPVEAARPMLATPAPTKVPRILLVDDNSINLQLLVTFMKKAKFPYAAASDGLEALNTYKAAASSSPSTMRPAFDYVLMDISMPVMDGLTSTREIRKFEKENKLRPAKIFALTGLASESAQKEAFESGIDHFLPKPVNFRELRALVEKIDDGQEARAVVAEVVGVK